jgi:hypothetical protein
MNRFQTTFRLLLLTAVLLLATAVTLSATSATAKHRTSAAAAKHATAKALDVNGGETKCADPACPAMTRVAAKPASVKSKPAAVTSKAATPASAPVAAGTAGLRIYLDPETGVLGGPANGAALANDIDPLNDSVEGLTEVRMPDGSYMLDMKGRFAEYAMIQTDANGKRVFRCVGSRKELLQPAPAPAPREDR